MNIKSILQKEIHFKKINNKQISFFFRELYICLKVGISISDAILILKEEKSFSNIKRKLESIVCNIRNGCSFSESIQREKIFDKFVVFMIVSGEESGKLEYVVKNLADYYERKYELENNIRKLLIYPALLFFITLAVLVLLLNYVLPSFEMFFMETKSNLPMSTRILLDISKVFRQMRYVIFISILFLIFIFKILYIKYRYIFDKFKLRLKYIGSLIRVIETERISRNIYIMIENGVEILKAIEITENGCKNMIFKEALSEIRTQLKNGIGIYDSFKSEKIFLELFMSFLKVGEESGELSQIFEYSAYHYNKEIDYQFKMTVTVLESFLILLMALIIGFIVFSVAVPMFELINTFDI